MRFKADVLRWQPACSLVVQPYIHSPHARRGLYPPSRESIQAGRTACDTLSPAVRNGNLRFISGLTAIDERGTMVGTSDIVAQTQQIFEKIKAILEAAGGSFDAIVKTVDYIVTTEGYNGTADVRRAYFRHGFPAATGIVVKELLRPGALIEIEAIAVLEDKH